MRCDMNERQSYVLASSCILKLLRNTGCFPRLSAAGANCSGGLGPGESSNVIGQRLNTKLNRLLPPPRNNLASPSTCCLFPIARYSRNIRLSSTQCYNICKWIRRPQHLAAQRVSKNSLPRHRTVRTALLQLLRRRRQRWQLEDLLSCQRTLRPFFSQYTPPPS
jgi:hypothetical protein